MSTHVLMCRSSWTRASSRMTFTRPSARRRLVYASSPPCPLSLHRPLAAALLVHTRYVLPYVCCCSGLLCWPLRSYYAVQVDLVFTAHPTQALRRSMLKNFAVRRLQRPEAPWRHSAERQQQKERMHLCGKPARPGPLVCPRCCACCVRRTDTPRNLCVALVRQAIRTSLELLNRMRCAPMHALVTHFSRPV